MCVAVVGVSRYVQAAYMYVYGCVCTRTQGWWVDEVIEPGVTDTSACHLGLRNLLSPLLRYLLVCVIIVDTLLWMCVHVHTLATETMKP